jgi:glycosyltransferase involved in cell wall biosynthesis
MDRKIKIAYLLTHPIQYFSPLFREFSKRKDIEFIVYYCSDESIRGSYDPNFKTKVKWDIPILEGYRYKFLKNHSPFPSIYKPLSGLINFGIIKELKNKRFDFIVVNGWNFGTAILTFILSRFFRTKVCVFNEAPFKLEFSKKNYLKIIKKIFFRFLFSVINYFIVPGCGGEKFLEYYGVKDDRIIKTGYPVDNDFFSSYYKKYRKKRKELRKELNIPYNKFIILFVGKLISKKNPLILLKVLKELKNENIFVVFVGDGPLRNDMMKYIEENKLKNVSIKGFVNQSEIPKYYAVSDILVLPSICCTETWGLVVNEAFNFGIPAIVSEYVGCANELVIDGYNGFVFKDENDLKDKIEKLYKDRKMLEKFGENAKISIKEMNYKNYILRLIKFYYETKTSILEH